LPQVLLGFSSLLGAEEKGELVKGSWSFSASRSLPLHLIRSLKRGRGQVKVEKGRDEQYPLSKGAEDTSKLLPWIDLFGTLVGKMCPLLSGCEHLRLEQTLSSKEGQGVESLSAMWGNPAMWII